MFLNLAQFAPYTSLVGFLIGLPTAMAAYYQSFKARQEAREARDGLHSRNCLEFVLNTGECINLVPLETLHTLPKPGDIVLLPGDGHTSGTLHPNAYRIERVEHIYMLAAGKTCRPREARLTKAVATVSFVHS